MKVLGVFLLALAGLAASYLTVVRVVDARAEFGDPLKPRRFPIVLFDSRTEKLRLFHAYQQCQSAGKAFVLNVGPLPSGTIPDDQLAVLKQMKNLIAHPPPPVAPVAAAPAAAPEAKPEPAERLKKIKSLFEQGLISKEDYEKKVKGILDPL